jgi:hypothetical protein
MLRCALRGRRPLRGAYTPSVGAPVGRDHESFPAEAKPVYMSRSDRSARSGPGRKVISLRLVLVEQDAACVEFVQELIYLGGDL